jgi:hypothetical protein
MNKSYDFRRADSLIPLLQVLNREIEERTKSVRSATHRVHRLRRSNDLTSTERRNKIALLEAEISNHKREIRYTKKELEELGCIVDTENPSTVLIPGRDGSLAAGYEWRLGDTRVHPPVGN